MPTAPVKNTVRLHAPWVSKVSMKCLWTNTARQRLMPYSSFPSMSEFRPKLEALKEEDLQFLAESAHADACAPGNPKDASVEDLKALFRKLM